MSVSVRVEASTVQLHEPLNQVSTHIIRVHAAAQEVSLRKVVFVESKRVEGAWLWRASVQVVLSVECAQIHATHTHTLTHSKSVVVGTRSTREHKIKVRQYST